VVAGGAIDRRRHPLQLGRGATRLRPIFLTAGAAMFGSFVITLDPIFSGLAWSFIFGIFTSTAFSLVVVPLVYYLLHDKDAAAPGLCCTTPLT
jgi:multidrug efflux pump subunit AcrB